MKDTREQAKHWLEQDEGGFTNERTDPGGPTKFGITIHDYRSFFQKPQATAKDVENLTIEQAFEIYDKRYWDPVSADLLPYGVDYFTFDSGMLNGVGTAIRWLQRAVGASPDGIIGPKTLDAIGRDHPLDILVKMEALRRQRLRSLALWSVYGRGWTNRVNKAMVRARKLISSHPGLDAAHPTPSTPQGKVTEKQAVLDPKPEEAILVPSSATSASPPNQWAQGTGGSPSQIDPSKFQVRNAGGGQAPPDDSAHGGGGAG